MIKKYYQYNEGIFDLFKKKKKEIQDNRFEFDIDPNYEPSKFEKDLYSKLGFNFEDCLQEFLDDNSGKFVFGFGNLRYPVLTFGIRFDDFYSLSESINMIHSMDEYIEMAISMIDVDIVRIVPHLASRRNNNHVTYKIDRLFNSDRFTIRENFIIMEEIYGNFSRTAIFFSILNPYYSEFNYGK